MQPKMATADVEALADEDLKGSRLLLVRRAVEAIDLDGTAGGVIQFACTFQSAERGWFVSAQFRLRLSETRRRAPDRSGATDPGRSEAGRVHA